MENFDSVLVKWNLWAEEQIKAGCVLCNFKGDTLIWGDNWVVEC